MITNTREALAALMVADSTGDEKKLSEVVGFLRKNPTKLDEFLRAVYNASDASNHVTPYRRISLVLQRALKSK